MEILGFTFTFLGELLIGYTAIAVHYRFRKEHKVDEKVFMTMRREHTLGILGLAALILGYFIQMAGRIF
jgi:hypothetical protein